MTTRSYQVTMEWRTPIRKIRVSSFGVVAEERVGAPLISLSQVPEGIGGVLIGRVWFAPSDAKTQRKLRGLWRMGSPLAIANKKRRKKE